MQIFLTQSVVSIGVRKGKGAILRLVRYNTTLIGVLLHAKAPGGRFHSWLFVGIHALQNNMTAHNTMCFVELPFNTNSVEMPFKYFFLECNGFFYFPTSLEGKESTIIFKLVFIVPVNAITPKH